MQTVLYQRDIRRPLPEPGEAEYIFLLDQIKNSSSFIFPEYFAFHSALETEESFLNYSSYALEWLKTLSAEKEARGTLIVGGSLLLLNSDKVYNSTPIFFEAEQVGSYQKQRLFGHEIGRVEKGSGYTVIKHPVTYEKWGFLICADVFIPGVFENYRDCDNIAIPTSSPFREVDSEQERKKRDFEIFVRGASESNSTIFKCCSVGQVGKDTGKALAPRLQGRSLIANRSRVIDSAPGIHWSGAISFFKDLTTTRMNFSDSYEAATID